MTRDVVLGLGGCLDSEIVWDDAVVQQLVDAHAIGSAEIGRDVTVGSERDLLRSVLGFVDQGGGGERFVTSSDIVERFAGRFDQRITLGGTNVRAAAAMSMLGLPSVLHLVSVDDHVRRLLPAGVRWVCSAERDSTDPHLIVQYPQGAAVELDGRRVVAPRANRLIYVNDPPNRRMALSPRLGDLLANARIFLISGFNTMQDADLLDRRLAELRHHMRRLPDDAVVVFEDAGYHVPGTSGRVREALLDRVDVYGLNEDELQEQLGRRVDLLDADAMAAAFDELREAVPARLLVVHSQSWAIAVGADADRYAGPLESATAMAGARYLFGDGAGPAHFHAMPQRPREPRAEALRRQLTAARPGQVCVVPAYRIDCHRPTTVGLGDAFVGGLLAGLLGTTPSG